MASRHNKKSPDELDSQQAAEYLGYTLQTFYQKVKAIRHRKYRGVLYFTKDALDEFQAGQTTEHIPEPAA